MSETHSGAVVFFGAIGDLAYKKIFPSLQGVVREHLNVLSSVSPTRTGTRTNPKLSRATALRNTECSILRRSRSWPACCDTSTATTRMQGRSPPSTRSSAAHSGQPTTPAIPPVLSGKVLEQLETSVLRPIGTIRARCQNHLFQVMANLAMEPPARWKRSDIEVKHSLPKPIALHGAPRGTKAVSSAKKRALRP